MPQSLLLHPDIVPVYAKILNTPEFLAKHKLTEAHVEIL
jgi:hypothetical protein